ncbi:hypothetical protein D3C87_2036950 [compost metagenome]
MVQLYQVRSQEGTVKTCCSAGISLFQRIKIWRLLQAIMVYINAGAGQVIIIQVIISIRIIVYPGPPE